MEMDARSFLSATSSFLSEILDSAKSKLIGSNRQLKPTVDEQKVAGSDNNAYHHDKYQPIERLFIWFQGIVYWHEPIKSMTTICGILTTFLLFSYIYEPRFYPCLLMCAFVYNLTMFWFQHVWPEIRVEPTAEDEYSKWTHLHPQFITLTEFGLHLSKLRDKLTQLVDKLCNFRQQNRIKFCLINCFVFALTACIGELISGLNIFLITLFVILFGPGFHSYVFPILKKKIQTIINLLPINAQLTTPSREHSLRKFDTSFARRKSSVETMTPIIEEDAQTYQSSTQSTLDLHQKFHIETTKTSVIPEFSLTDVLQETSKSQHHQTSSSNSSSGSQLCSDASLIDLDEEQPDDFVIL